MTDAMPHAASDSAYLAIYLNDHLAGATVGVQLARRAARSRAGSPAGAELAELATDVEADRVTLTWLMSLLDVAHDRRKTTAAAWGERLGRLKPNGRVLGRSPLSHVVEAEALLLGVEGKLLLWSGLDQLLADDPRLSSVDFPALQARAREQRDRLEAIRRPAVLTALAS